MYVIMFLYAVSNTFIGPLVTVFMEQYEISLSANGLIFFCQGLGGIAFLIIGVIFGDRLMKSTWIILTFGTYGVLIILLSSISAYYQLLIIFFLVGGITRLLDAMLNANIAQIYREKRAFFLNILHACFGAGALIGPVLSSVFVSENIRMSNMFFGLGSLCALAFAAFIYINKRTSVISAEAESKTIAAVVKLIKNPNMVIMSISASLYVGYALGISAWFPTYMLQVMRTSVLFSGLIVSVFWAGIITGRVAHSFLSLRYNKRRLLIFGNLIGGTAYVSAALLNVPIAYVFGLFVSAFFTSAGIPLMMAMAGELFPRQTGSASSVIMLGGAIGLMLVPWIIGIVAESVSYWVAILILGLLSYAASILAALLKTGKKTGARL